MSSRTIAPSVRLSRAHAEYTGRVLADAANHPLVDDEGLRDALMRQDDEAHDRSLILERLAWTPEQRLAANAAFLRFYLTARPSGPLIRDD